MTSPKQTIAVAMGELNLYVDEFNCRFGRNMLSRLQHESVHQRTCAVVRTHKIHYRLYTLWRHSVVVLHTNGREWATEHAVHWIGLLINNVIVTL